MKKKKKAFTLLELIITLAITVMVLGVIYTFFLSNTKTLTTTEINTDLQNESQDIQDAILKYGTEANRIISIIINTDEIEETDKIEEPEEIDNVLYIDIKDTLGKIKINQIAFEVDGEEYKFIKNNKKLSLIKPNEEVVVLSNNVEEFQIRPLDYRMKIDENTGELSKANGIEVSYVLNIKKGYSNVSVPGSIIVKFRNKSNN